MRRPPAGSEVPASAVRRVFARVRLDVAADAIAPDWPGTPREHRGGRGHHDRSWTTSLEDRLRLIVDLSAELADGSRIRTRGSDFTLSGPRTGPGAIWHKYHGSAAAGDSAEPPAQVIADHRVSVPDIEDGVNQLLGRDPALHIPPRLAWENLLQALAIAGIAVDEQEIISCPLVLEVDREVRAQLEPA